MSTSHEPVPRFSEVVVAAPETAEPAAERPARRLPLPGTTQLGVALVVIGGAYLLWIPHGARPSTLFRWNEVLIFTLFAMSVNLLLGQTGLLSFGQAAYFGAGAYAMALLIQHHHSAPLSLLLAALVALGIAFGVGVLILRTSGIAFAMLTLAFAQMAFTLVFKVHALGGENGLSNIVRHEFFGFDIRKGSHYYYLTFAIVVLCMVIMWWFVNSPFGLTLRVIREDAGRGEFLGLRVRLYQLAAFTLAGLFAGVAGALFALLQGFVSADALYWTKSADPIVMTILGGAGFFLGPALGAGVYQNLTDWLQKRTIGWELWIGVLLMALILVAPGGILGLLAHIRAMLAGEEAPFWRRWSVRRLLQWRAR